MIDFLSAHPLRDLALIWLSRLRSVCVYAALLSQPFFWGGKNAEGEPVLRFLALGLFLSYGLEVCFRRESPASRSANPLIPAVFLAAFVPFLGYVFLQGLSGHAIFTGMRFGTVLRHDTIDNAVQLFCYGLLLLVFYAHFKTRRRVQTAVLLLGLELVVLMAVGFYYEHSELVPATRVWGINMQYVGKYYSFFINNNHYGAFLAAVLPLMAAAIMDYWKKWTRQDSRLDLVMVEKLFFALLFPVCVISILDADARGALCWLFLTVLSMVLFLPGMRRGLALTAAPIAGALAYIMLRNPQMALDKLSTDLNGRSAFTRAAADLLIDFQFFGCGAGTFFYVFPHYNQIQPENISPDQPFNHHLQLLIETGIGGYAMFVLPFGLLAALCLPRILKSRSRWEKTFGLTALMVVATAALIGFFDNYPDTPAVAVVLVLYLALAMRAAEGAFFYDAVELPPSPRRLDRVRLAAFLAVAALLVPVTDYAVRDYVSDRNSTAPSKSESGLREAVDATPDHLGAWLELGDYYYAQAIARYKAKQDGGPDALKAVEAFRKCADLAPTWPKSWDRLGQSEVLFGERLKGLSHLGYAIQLQPLNRDRYLYVIVLSLKLARTAPWKQERQIASQLAYAWIDKASTLPRPLTVGDCGYLGVFGKGRGLSAIDKAHLHAAIHKYHRTRKKGNLPSPVELAS